MNIPRLHWHQTLRLLTAKIFLIFQTMVEIFVKSGINYHVVISIRGIKFSYVPSGTIGSIDVTSSIIDRNNYRIHLTGNNMYIDHVIIQVLFITTQLFQTPFTLVTGGSYVRNTLYNSPSLNYLTDDNAFGTIFHFHCGMGVLDYEFVTDSGILYVDMFGWTDEIYGNFIILALKKCLFPYSYYPPTSSCITCPRNCLSCTPTLCARCVKTFTLSADNKSCICSPPLQAISNICYDFASHP